MYLYDYLCEDQVEFYTFQVSPYFLTHFFVGVKTSVLVCVCARVTQIYFSGIYNSWSPPFRCSEDCGEQFMLKSLIK